MKQITVTFAWVLAIPVIFAVSFFILGFTLAPIFFHFVPTGGIPRPAAIYTGCTALGLSLPVTLVCIYFFRKKLIKKFSL